MDGARRIKTFFYSDPVEVILSSVLVQRIERVRDQKVGFFALFKKLYSASPTRYVDIFGKKWLVFSPDEASNANKVWHKSIVIHSM